MAIMAGKTEETSKKVESFDDMGDETKDHDAYEGIDFPKPWKFEKFFIGGYTQERMIKTKNPQTMYKAINLFAGNQEFPPFQYH